MKTVNYVNDRQFHGNVLVAGKDLFYAEISRKNFFW